MNTRPPEPSPEQIAQWWAEARDVHADNPGLAPLQLARIAYAAGWKARAAVKESLTTEAPSAGLTIQLPEEAPDEHPPSSLDRREVAAWYHGHSCGWQAARAALAAAPPADLLERQAAPVPVAVSERLPEAEDCDAEERCWLLAPRWILPPAELTHWLPAHALPLPSGEVG